MKFIMITNNQLVYEKLCQAQPVKNLAATEYLEGGTYLSVLETARDYIHKGHQLLTHPLTGSIKPNETPYKSIIVSEKIGTLDAGSLSIIEESIQTTLKFLAQAKVRNYTEQHHIDFMTIDRHIIESGIESINQFQ